MPLRQHLPTLRDFCLLVVERFRSERCSQVAGSLAFTTLLALVPLLAVAVALISRFDFFTGLGEALRAFLLANLLPEKAGKVVAAYALQFTQQTARLTALGSALVFATAIMLTLTIDHVFSGIWRVSRPRPLLRRVAIYLAALLFGPVALGGSIVATTYLVTASLGLVGEPRWISTLLLSTLPEVMLAALFSFLYYVIPNRPVQLKHAVAGGVFAALGFAVMQRLFGLYIAKVPTYTLIYGTFATVPIFLVWLYLSWLVVLVGALVAALLPEFASRFSDES